jgi:superfamily I DNA/RNA helicase
MLAGRWADAVLAPGAPAAAARRTVVAAAAPSPSPPPARPAQAGPTPGMAAPHLAGLSVEQAAAACSPLGATRVVAGPGSGKTRVLTARAAHLVHAHGASPWQVAAITFTNKAADELRERLGAALGPAAAGELFAGTFHSLCYRVLRRSLSRLPGTGRTENWTLYDQDAALALLSKLVRAAHPDWSAADARDAARGVQGRVSRLKNGLLSCHGLGGERAVAAFAALERGAAGGAATPAEQRADAELAAWFDAYECALRAADALDFDDLLGGAVALLRGDAELRGRLRRRWRHVLVDEFQARGNACFACFVYVLPPRSHARFQAPGCPPNQAQSAPLLAAAAGGARAAAPALGVARSRVLPRPAPFAPLLQDTNAPQYELVRLLAGPEPPTRDAQPASAAAAAAAPPAPVGSVFVVGDPDQAIYGWRGAEVGNMRDRFLKDFPSAALHRLCDNYRSSPAILGAAAAVIARSPAGGGGGDRAPLRPRRPAGPAVRVHVTQDAYEEADYIASEVAAALAAGACRQEEIAVLLRTHAQARPVEAALVAAGVPYVLVGGTPFWRRTEVQDVMAYLRLAVAPSDGVALDRILNVPKRGLGPASVAKLAAAAAAARATLPELLFGAAGAGGDSGALALPPLPPPKALGLSPKAAGAVEAFRAAVAATRAAAAARPLGAALEAAMQAVGYEAHVREGGCGGKAGDEGERLARLRQLARAATAYTPGSLAGAEALDAALDEALLLGDKGAAAAAAPAAPPVVDGAAVHGLPGARAFLEEAALYSGVEEGEEAAGGVRLCTMHAAKGLEFHTVFVPGERAALRSTPRAVLWSTGRQPRTCVRGPSWLAHTPPLSLSLLSPSLALSLSLKATPGPPPALLLSPPAAALPRALPVAGCNEGLVPFGGDECDDLEEETRLFFVSMTRAKRDLRLLHSREHATHGFKNRRPNDPSRFLSDVVKSGHAVVTEAPAPQPRAWGGGGGGSGGLRYGGGAAGQARFKSGGNKGGGSSRSASSSSSKAVEAAEAPTAERSTRAPPPPSAAQEKQRRRAARR